MLGDDLARSNKWPEDGAFLASYQFRMARKLAFVTLPICLTAEGVSPKSFLKALATIWAISASEIGFGLTGKTWSIFVTDMPPLPG